MQVNPELTAEEKARIMHNKYQREWARKNKEKVRKSQIKSLAKKYDEMIDQMVADFAEGGGVNVKD